MCPVAYHSRWWITLSGTAKHPFGRGAHEGRLSPLLRRSDQAQRQDVLGLLRVEGAPAEREFRGGHGHVLVFDPELPVLLAHEPCKHFRLGEPLGCAVDELHVLVVCLNGTVWASSKTACSYLCIEVAGTLGYIMASQQ